MREEKEKHTTEDTRNETHMVVHKWSADKGEAFYCCEANKMPPLHTALKGGIKTEHEYM
jgi:hypothetical protein